MRRRSAGRRSGFAGSAAVAAAWRFAFRGDPVPAGEAPTPGSQRLDLYRLAPIRDAN